jgi:pimeloyl-ACP methyl ester carboxylesterase
VFSVKALQSSGVHRFSSAALVLCAAALCGCVSSLLARKVVAPPNKSGIPGLFADSAAVRHAPDAFAAEWRVPVGRPRAELAMAAIEPGDYGFRYDLRLSYPEGGDPRVDRFEVGWRPAAQRVPWQGPPRGTVLLLHGYLQDKRSVTPWALALAEAGFRCALVDLRGHGASTGRHISFGAFEARDVSAVIDVLGWRGWDVSRVGVLGVSYGASVALLAAGRDPRIAAVVAFEPFASAERAVPELMRAVFTREARGISDAQFARAHVKQARIAGFDWADADIPAALARTTAPVLFLHGEADRWLSPDHSRALARVAPAGSELVLVPNDNHVSLPLQVNAFRERVTAWFGRLSSR